jgi:hypothetical protein
LLSVHFPQIGKDRFKLPMISFSLIPALNGKLSNVSTINEEDQVIPDADTATSRRRITRMIEESTVADHFESVQGSQRECDTNYTGEHGSRHRNQGPPRKPTNNKDLHRLVERVYRDGSRSPQLVGLVHSVRAAIPLRVAIASAEYIERVWEGKQNSEVCNQSRTQHSLTNYIANILYRLSPSVITVFAAIFYVGRLRRLYPKAVGEEGCGHRLFTISLLIAYRYLERQVSPAEDFYQTWSAFSNHVFQPADLFRMELEFVAFLKFNLYITYDDFEYFVDRVYNSDGGQIVPRCLSIPQLSQPFGTTSQEEDASVPSVQNFSL